MRRPTVRYHKVLHELDPRFEPAYRLYEQTFPPSERMDRHAFVDVLRRKRLGQLSPSNFHMIVALQGEEVIGMGSGRYVSSANVGYIAYLVVGAAHKGRRVGPGIRNHLITSFRQDAELSGQPHLDAVVGEVEPENRWLRILAGRHQAMALDIDYEQPRLSPQAACVPLVLYYQPLHPIAASLPAAYVRRIVESLYREIYRMENPLDHPVFQRFLRQLDGRETIGHRPLRPDGGRRPRS